MGVNDMWRRYDAGEPTTAETLAENYSPILEAARARLEVQRLVIMEPFPVPITDEQQTWYAEDLAARSL